MRRASLSQPASPSAAAAAAHGATGRLSARRATLAAVASGAAASAGAAARRAGALRAGRQNSSPPAQPHSGPRPAGSAQRVTPKRRHSVAIGSLGSPSSSSKQPAVRSPTSLARASSASAAQLSTIADTEVALSPLSAGAPGAGRLSSRTPRVDSIRGSKSPAVSPTRRGSGATAGGGQSSGGSSAVLKQETRAGEEVLLRRQMRALAARTHSLAAQRERESAARRSEEETRVEAQRMLAEALYDGAANAAEAASAQQERDALMEAYEKLEHTYGEMRQRLTQMATFKDRAEAMEAKVRTTSAQQYQLQARVADARRDTEAAHAARDAAFEARDAALEARDAAVRRAEAAEAREQALMDEKRRSEQAAAAAGEQMALLLRRVEMVEESTPQRAYVVELEQRCRRAGNDAQSEATTRRDAEHARDAAVEAQRSAEARVSVLEAKVTASERRIALAEEQRVGAEAAVLRMEEQLHESRLASLEGEQRLTAMEAAMRSLNTTNAQLASGLNEERKQRTQAEAVTRSVEERAAGAFVTAARARATFAATEGAASVGTPPPVGVTGLSSVGESILAAHRHVAAGLSLSPTAAFASPGMA